MARKRILVTNDDGWDAPGLLALKDLAACFGDVFVVAPRDPHSYAGHRVTTDAPLALTQTGPKEYHLSGTPADCVRLAVTTLLPGLDWVFSGINRGGNLGVDIYSSGTVAAAREGAFLGLKGVAISQYVQRGMVLDWKDSARIASPILANLLESELAPKEYWNVNLPHLPPGETAAVECCQPDNAPLDIRFRRDGEHFRYDGTYAGRPRTSGCDVERCFQGAATVSLLRA